MVRKGDIPGHAALPETPFLISCLGTRGPSLPRAQGRTSEGLWGSGACTPPRSRKPTQRSVDLDGRSGQYRVKWGQDRSLLAKRMSWKSLFSPLPEFHTHCSKGGGATPHIPCDICTNLPPSCCLEVIFTSSRPRGVIIRKVRIPELLSCCP